MIDKRTGVVVYGKTLMNPTQIECARREKGSDFILENDPRIRFLVEHGNFSLAYSTLQEGLDYFVVGNLGYVAFARTKGPFGTTHVLGDPVSSPGDSEELIAGFLHRFPDACFAQVRHRTSRLLHDDFRFYSNEAGYESVIEVDRFDLAGKMMADLRRYKNVCDKHGLNVVEGRVSPLNVETLKKISHEWMRKKLVNSHELAFLARRMVYSNEFDVRYFFATMNDEIVGFVVYDPLYERGRIIGLEAVVQRARGSAPEGTLDAINLHVIETIRREGKCLLSLGFAPFAEIRDAEGINSTFTTMLFRAAYERANMLYAFQNLDFHKKRYRGRLDKVYFCSKHRVPVKQVFDEFRLCGVIDRNIICSISRAIGRSLRHQGTN